MFDINTDNAPWYAIVLLVITWMFYKVSIFFGGIATKAASHISIQALKDIEELKNDRNRYATKEDIRKLDEDIPIFFLTAKSLSEDRVQGFKSGGDDYLTKPFNMEEFLLRIDALFKRTGKKSDSKKSVQIGKYIFDFDNYTLSNDNKEKKLTKKEAEVLKLLCQYKNKVLERDLVLNMVWGDNSYYLGRSLDVFITKLRKYLKDDTTVSISNIHGVGFKLEC